MTAMVRPVRRRATGGTWWSGSGRAGGRSRRRSATTHQRVTARKRKRRPDGTRPSPSNAATSTCFVRENPRPPAGRVGAAARPAPETAECRSPASDQVVDSPTSASRSRPGSASSSTRMRVNGPVLGSGARCAQQVQQAGAPRPTPLRLPKGLRRQDRRSRARCRSLTRPPSWPSAADRAAHGEAGMRTIASRAELSGPDHEYSRQGWTGTQVGAVTNWHHAAKRCPPRRTGRRCSVGTDRDGGGPGRRSTASGNGHGRADPSSTARGTLRCPACSSAAGGESMRMGRASGRRLGYTCRNARGSTPRPARSAAGHPSPRRWAPSMSTSSR